MLGYSVCCASRKAPMIDHYAQRSRRDFTLADRPHPLDWMAAHMDYARVPDYDTPFKGKFDADLMPFWRAPLGDMHDAEVREVVVVKCSRAGADEHLAIGDTLYTLAVDPQSTLYVTRDEDLAEGFMDRRFKRGVHLASETAAAWRGRTKDLKYEIQFGSMDLRAYWAKAGGVSKQDGWPRIIASEVSCWPGFAPSMIRKRADMYEFHHIAFYSSPDPTRKGNPENDPILVLWRHTDQRVWMMPDPSGRGREFFYEFGGKDEPHGLKWETGDFDTDTIDGQLRQIDLARESAYYVTRHGTRIDNDARDDLVRAGRWQPTREDAAPNTRGYRITRPMIPIGAGDYGHLAADFLKAKYNFAPDGTKAERMHSPLRVYFAEMWGEAHREDQLQVVDDTLSDCEADYALKEVHVIGGSEARYGVIITADVQKHHIWWLARVWEMYEDQVQTSLLDFGTTPTIADFDQIVQSSGARVTGIDIGYALRASEVADYCADYTPQRHPDKATCFALRGEQNMSKSVLDVQVRDALEGRSRRSGRSLYNEVRWNADVFRSWLVGALGGQSSFGWHVPAKHGDSRNWAEYLRQVTSTRKIDGEWVPPKHGQDHLFDCEVEQLVLARHDELIR